MFDTVMQIQQTDMSDPEKSKDVIARIHLLVNAFDTHAHHEDHFVFNAAEIHAPSLIAEFEQEHEKDHQLSNEIRSLLAAYEIAEDKFGAGRALYYAVNEFVAFNLQHTNKEETILNEVLWKHYTDGEILDMQRSIERSVSPEEIAMIFEWMVRGINDVELLGWLNAVKREAPEFVLNMILEAGARHLPEARWSRIERALTEGVVAG
jgi:iron-sulfur cluster repair protein YtfE (RIC family)